MAKSSEFPVSIVIQAVDKVSGNIGKITAQIDAASLSIKKINKNLYEATGLNKLQDAFFKIEKSAIRLGKNAFHLGGFDTLAKSGADLGRKMLGVFSSIGSSFKSLLGTLAGASFIFGGGGFAVFETFKSMSQDVMAISRSSARFGISPNVFQGLQFAAEKAGIPVEKLDRMMRKLSLSSSQAMLGRGEGAAAFQAIGLSPMGSRGKKKGLDTILGEVLDKLKGKSAAFQNTILSMLVGVKGMDIGNLLKFGSAGLTKERERLKELYGTLDPEFISRAEAFNSKWIEFKWTFKGLRDVIGNELFPVVNNLTQAFTEFLLKNKVRIREFAQEFASNLPSNLKRVGDFFERLKEVVSPLIGLFETLSRHFGAANVVLSALALKVAIDVAPAISALSSAVLVFGEALMTTPVGWFLGGLSALAGAIYLLTKHWDDFLATFHQVKIIMREPLGFDVSDDYKFLNQYDRNLAQKEKSDGETWNSNASGNLSTAPNSFQIAKFREKSQSGSSVTSEQISKVILEFRNAPPGMQTIASDKNVKINIGSALNQGWMGATQ